MLEHRLLLLVPVPFVGKGDIPEDNLPLHRGQGGGPGGRPGSLSQSIISVKRAKPVMPISYISAKSTKALYSGGVVAALPCGLLEQEDGPGAVHVVLLVGARAELVPPP